MWGTFKLRGVTLCYADCSSLRDLAQIKLVPVHPWLVLLTRGVTRRSASPPDFREVSSHSVPVEPRQVQLPTLYRFVLVDAFGAVDLPSGKTSFDVGFRFRGDSGDAGLREVGVRLYVDTAVPEANSAFVKELIDSWARGRGRASMSAIANALLESRSQSLASRPDHFLSGASLSSLEFLDHVPVR